MFSLQNKKAVVTGGGSGIGKAISVLFAQQVAEVHIIELTEESAKAAVEDIKANGNNVFAHACNVASQQEVIGTFNKIGNIKSWLIMLALLMLARLIPHWKQNLTVL